MTSHDTIANNMTCDTSPGVNAICKTKLSKGTVGEIFTLPGSTGFQRIISGEWAEGNTSPLILK